MTGIGVVAAVAVADAVIRTFEESESTGISAIVAVVVVDAVFGTSDGFDLTGIGAGRTAILEERDQHGFHLVHQHCKLPL